MSLCLRTNQSAMVGGKSFESGWRATFIKHLLELERAFVGRQLWGIYLKIVDAPRVFMSLIKHPVDHWKIAWPTSICPCGNPLVYRFERTKYTHEPHRE